MSTGTFAQPFGGTGGEAPRLDAAAMAWNTVASFPAYDQAQAAVDRLSDDGFPVEYLDIVGSDLKTVERVTGRLTTGRATMIGAGSGAWFGLLIGLLVGLFTTGADWIGLVIGGLVIGAVWGAVFGGSNHYATHGRRDFASVSTLVAQRYDVVARGGQADAAKSKLAQAGLATA